MKKILLFLVITGSISGTAFAQLPAPSDIKMPLPPTIFLTDIQGKRTIDEWNRREIKGTPFFSESWNTAFITLADKRSFDKISVRLNCVNNTLHYLNTKKEELVAPDGVIREIKLIDSSSGGLKEYTFVSGFPAIDKHDENTFYERQVNGKAQLLVFTKKKISEMATMGSISGEKEYVPVETVYIYKDGVVSAWKKDRQFIIDLLSDKKEAISAYIGSQHLKCKTLGDLKLILIYYNSL